MLENKKLSPKNVYNKIRNRFEKGHSPYKEEIHCPLIFKVMQESGRVTDFCKEALVSDTTFYNWCNRYPIFNECYRLGKMIAQRTWEEDGERGRFDPDFNIQVWKTEGMHYFNIGQTNKIRLNIDIEQNPLEQFKQIMKQAATGEFTSSEIKQVMESMNFGVRAYEVFEMQKQIDEMKDDLVKMEKHENEQNIIPIEGVKKKN